MTSGSVSRPFSIRLPRITAAAPANLRDTVEHALRGASASGLDAGFWLAGGVGVLAGLLVLALVRPGPPRSNRPAAPAAESVTA